MVPNWVDMMNRASALGVFDSGASTFEVVHEPGCLSCLVAKEAERQGFKCVTADLACNCRPHILWMNIGAPSEMIHILVDRSDFLP